MYNINIRPRRVGGNIDSGLLSGERAINPATKKISISNIGSGPVVEFFDRMNGTDLQTLASHTPEIGVWNAVTNSGGVQSRLTEFNGRTWNAIRDPSLVADPAVNRTESNFLISPSTEFFFSGRLGADPTKIAVGADIVGGNIVQTASILKPFWFSDSDNTVEVPDIIIGSWVAGGSFIGGNTNQPTRASNGSLFYYPSISGRPMDVNADLLVGYYQSGRESVSGAKDALIELSSTSSNGTVITSALGNPYTPNVQGTGIVDFNYRKMFWGAYFGNLSNANNSNIQLGGADFYCAVGPNARARVIASNNAVLTSSTIAYNIPPINWSNIDGEITFAPHAREAALGFYHVILGDGSIRNNVSVSNI